LYGAVAGGVKHLPYAVFAVFERERWFRKFDVELLLYDFPKWQVVYKYFRHWSQKPSDDEPKLGLSRH